MISGRISNLWTIVKFAKDMENWLYEESIFHVFNFDVLFQHLCLSGEITAQRLYQTFPSFH
jgi:hypothetical protein